MLVLSEVQAGLKEEELQLLIHPGRDEVILLSLSYVCSGQMLCGLSVFGEIVICCAFTGGQT